MPPLVRSLPLHPHSSAASGSVPLNQIAGRQDIVVRILQNEKSVDVALGVTYCEGIG